MSQLSRFKIEGLHNARTIDLRIKNNTLILVGENGTGKSTVVNLIYFFLTAQWNRTLETLFKSVSAEIDGKQHFFGREDIKLISEVSYPDNVGNFYRHVRKEVAELALSFSGKELSERARAVASLYGVPLRMIDRDIQALKKIPKDLRARLRELENAKTGVATQVLYLPTYRRIEQDLEKVLPGMNTKEFRKRRDVPRFIDRSRRYVELVEFGMEDVERTIKIKTTEIEKKVRADLSNLTGEYLRDVIRGTYQTANLSQFEETNKETFESILSRIPEEILKDGDKENLRQIVEEFNTTGAVKESSQVIAHFLTLLVQLYQKQKMDEKDIRDFIRVCNEGYLTGKAFNYDSNTFEVEIIQEAYGARRVLPISALSSGEKQIVSLFSHLYLESSAPFVIIDEPELSLSVPWQKRFLPDISKRSNGFIAVTHSPFIYDNEMRKYTHSLEEFIEPFEYDSALDEADFAPDYDDIPF